ncbi:MAG: hypothetical protein WAN20_14355 [Pseudonocardiaceae bacterium]
MTDPPTSFEQRQLGGGGKQPGSDDGQLVFILAAHEVVELVGECIPAVFALLVGQRRRSRLDKVARLVR